LRKGSANGASSAEHADMRVHVMQGAKRTRKRYSLAPSEVTSKKVKVRPRVADPTLRAVLQRLATMAILIDSEVYEDRDDSAIPFLLSVKPIK
jgi:hypothetical protein